MAPIYWAIQETLYCFWWDQNQNPWLRECIIYFDRRSLISGAIYFIIYLLYAINTGKNLKPSYFEYDIFLYCELWSRNFFYSSQAKSTILQLQTWNSSIMIIYALHEEYDHNQLIGKLVLLLIRRPLFKWGVSIIDLMTDAARVLLTTSQFPF